MISVPVIPESAPFSPAQRAWLNGFLAGLLSAPAADAPAPSNGNGHATSSARAAGWRDVEGDDTHYPWHDPALGLDARLELARDKPIEFRLMAAMAQLDCGSCGYRCRTYAKAIETGEETDLGKCTPGGGATARMLKILVKDASPNGNRNTAAAPAVPSVALAESKPAFDHDHPFPAPILEVRTLNGAGSVKDTRFVALSIVGSGIKYRAGDALGVFPENCFEEVDALVRLAGFSGGEPVVVRETMPLRNALIHHLDITNPSDEFYEMLAGRAADPREAESLRGLADGRPADGLVENPRVIDVMARFASARPSAAEFAKALRKLRPRLYSISSSPKAYPDEIHLTVGVVRYQKNGVPHKGVASTFLAERVQRCQPVRVYLKPSDEFRLPDDPDVPIIMVGPGTGIAPFRAFLQERRATGARGRSWLFFGNPHEAVDFLYRDELEEFVADGTLTRLHTAFSRDRDRKIYVQHRMLEHGAELFRWLEDGAHFYVCGDAARMALDVNKALRQLIAEHGRRNEDEVQAYVSNLFMTKRYQRDVY